MHQEIDTQITKIKRKENQGLKQNDNLKVFEKLKLSEQ